jgi:transcriptional regulator with XRE-family HTH domain
LRPLEGVREWRERRMLTQQELADRAGVSLFTVQRIERGEGNVRPKTGRAIAAALGVSVEDLLPKAQRPLPFEIDSGQPPETRTELKAAELAVAAQPLEKVTVERARLIEILRRVRRGELDEEQALAELEAA